MAFDPSSTPPIPKPGSPTLAQNFTTPPSKFSPTPSLQKKTSLIDSPGSINDSGVEDVFDSPTPKTRIVLERGRPAATSPTGWDEKQETGDRDEPTNKTYEEEPEDVVCRGLAENPFDNKQSRILFDATDRLQSWGSSKFLKIPQVRPPWKFNHIESNLRVACHCWRPVVREIVAAAKLDGHPLPRWLGVLYPLPHPGGVSTYRPWK